MRGQGGRAAAGVAASLGAVAIVLLAPGGAAVPVRSACAEPTLVVRKGARVLQLSCSGRPRARYRLSLGREPTGPKQLEGDGRTPEGDYYVCSRNERSGFHLFLGLSYPGPADAERGLRERLITPAQARQIVEAHAERRPPPWTTRLGGAVGIHGLKRGWGFLGRWHRFFDWTNGCLAVADHEIEELWELVPLGAPVRILP
jgi:murein L,D-transpeptidase YafK